MRKLFYSPVIWLAVTILFTLAFYACRRTSIFSPSGTDGPLSVTTAKKYFKEFTKTAGREVPKKFFTNSADSANSKPNKKYVMWKKAYTSENDQFAFVEAPLYYNQKISAVLSSDGEPIDQGVKRKIFDASLNRLVVYKDKKTGVIGQYIVNYIPDISYLEKHKYDISHNQINKLDKDFTGYIKYMTWDGEPKTILKIKDGKAVSKGRYRTEIINDKNGKTSRSLSGNAAAKEVCETWTEITLVMVCWVMDPEYPNVMECNEHWDFVDYEICHDDGTGYDFCSDPAHFDFPECYNGPNPPTGEGTPPPPTSNDVYNPGQLVISNYGPAIDLQQLFNCFNNVSDIGATYTVRLCVELPDNVDYNRLAGMLMYGGHSYITATKTNGNTTIAQSFGFYPIYEVSNHNSVFYYDNTTWTSKIKDDGGRKNDLYFEKTLSASDFAVFQNTAKSLAVRPYRVLSSNCTDYALDVFNAIVGPDLVVVNDWISPLGYNYGTTPSGLYKKLLLQTYTNTTFPNTSLYAGARQAPAGSGLCP
jgi:hypothetical protein